MAVRILVQILNFIKWLSVIKLLFKIIIHYLVLSCNIWFIIFFIFFKLKIVFIILYPINYSKLSSWAIPILPENCFNSHKTKKRPDKDAFIYLCWVCNYNLHFNSLKYIIHPDPLAGINTAKRSLYCPSDRLIYMCFFSISGTKIRVFLHII